MSALFRRETRGGLEIPTLAVTDRLVSWDFQFLSELFGFVLSLAVR